MQRPGSSPAASRIAAVSYSDSRSAAGLVRDGQRVQVDDAVDRLAAVLAGDVLHDRADVVAEVLAAGRLDAGEDSHGVREANEDGESSACRLVPLERDRRRCRQPVREPPILPLHPEPDRVPELLYASRILLPFGFWSAHRPAPRSRSRVVAGDRVGDEVLAADPDRAAVDEVAHLAKLEEVQVEAEAAARITVASAVHGGSRDSAAGRGRVAGRVRD